MVLGSLAALGILIEYGFELLKRLRPTTAPSSREHLLYLLQPHYRKCCTRPSTKGGLFVVEETLYFCDDSGQVYCYSETDKIRGHSKMVQEAKRSVTCLRRFQLTSVGKYLGQLAHGVRLHSLLRSGGTRAER